jgi:hypothetical protein
MLMRASPFILISFSKFRKRKPWGHVAQILQRTVHLPRESGEEARIWKRWRTCVKVDVSILQLNPFEGSVKKAKLDEKSSQLGTERFFII